MNNHFCRSKIRLLAILIVLTNLYVTVLASDGYTFKVTSQPMVLNSGRVIYSVATRVYRNGRSAGYLGTISSKSKNSVDAELQPKLDRFMVMVRANEAKRDAAAEEARKAAEEKERAELEAQKKREADAKKAQEERDAELARKRLEAEANALKEKRRLEIEAQKKRAEDERKRQLEEEEYEEEPEDDLDEDLPKKKKRWRIFSLLWSGDDDE